MTVVSRSSRYSGHDRVRCICYYETRPFLLLTHKRPSPFFYTYGLGLGSGLGLGLVLGLVLGLGLVIGSSLVGVCRRLAVVVSVTYTTVVYTTVVSIVDLWSIHDGRVGSSKARRSCP